MKQEIAPTPGLPSKSNAVDAAAAPALLARATRDAAIWSGLLQTPIDFTGRVVDTNGQSIGGATVTYWVAQKTGGGNATRGMQTDAKGFFHISDVNGLGLSVEISKPGYYKLKQSRGNFGYAQGTTTDRPAPTKGSQAIFVLRKAGEPQQLAGFKRFVKASKKRSANRC
jgi:hypothetical protein